MRYEGNKVVITESELRWLVNESVKNAILTETGNWSGVKNAWNGIINGKFDVNKSFQTAKQAQTFQKYYNNAQKYITGMQHVLNNSDQPDLASKLQQFNAELQQAVNTFQQRAAQASGRQQPQQPSAPNTNATTPKQAATADNTAKTIQMGPTATNQTVQQAGAAAKANPNRVVKPTSSIRNVVKNNNNNVMPESASKPVRITQEYIRSLVNETLNILMNEEGEAGGGGATNAAGTLQGGGTNPGSGTYDVPAFGGKSKKKVGGEVFSEPIMRQGHNLGDITKAPVKQVDMGPALDRTPGKVVTGSRKK